MSRLLDRILTSCQRFRPSMLYDEAQLLRQLRRSLGKADNERVSARTRQLFLDHEPTATVDPSPAKLENIPVIAADDVALYVSALELGTEMSDVVASLVGWRGRPPRQNRNTTWLG